MCGKTVKLLALQYCTSSKDISDLLELLYTIPQLYIVNYQYLLHHTYEILYFQATSSGAALMAFYENLLEPNVHNIKQ